MQPRFRIEVLSGKSMGLSCYSDSMGSSSDLSNFFDHGKIDKEENRNSHQELGPQETDEASVSAIHDGADHHHANYNYDNANYQWSKFHDIYPYDPVN